MNTKLNEIKITIEKWNNPMSLKRRDKVVLNCLRTGHTHNTLHTWPSNEKKSLQEHVLHADIQPESNTYYRM